MGVDYSNGYSELTFIFTFWSLIWYLIILAKAYIEFWMDPNKCSLTLKSKLSLAHQSTQGPDQPSILCTCNIITHCYNLSNGTFLKAKTLFVPFH